MAPVMVAAGGTCRFTPTLPSRNTRFLPFHSILGVVIVPSRDVDMPSEGSRNPIVGQGHAKRWLDTRRNGGVPIMHPCSPALRLMVERKTSQARFAEPMTIEPVELERSILRGLSDLAQKRPRIVEFASAVALKRALERVHTANWTREAA
jgi:hypothetical protein